MTGLNPSPQQAAASIEEAQMRVQTVRRSDLNLRLVLLVTAGLYLVSGALLSINPRGGNPVVGTALLLVLLAGLAGAVCLCLRVRAWSRAGIAWMLAAVAIFWLWNAAVIWISLATGWWGPGAPGSHFAGSVVVAVLPLLAGAALLGRR